MGHSIDHRTRAEVASRDTILKRSSRPRQPEPVASSFILQLQRSAGNRAVAELLGVQRQDDAESADGVGSACAGVTVTVDDLSDEIAVGEQTSDSEQNVQTYMAGQPLTVQRQGGSHAAAGSCPNPQWSDFATVAEDYSTFAAQSAPAWRAVNNRYVIVEDKSNMWAKQSAKTGPQSGPLLRHEWYHFKLQCVLSGKANAALDSGANARTITRQARTTSQAQSDSYDADTNHGLNASMQAAWEKDIDNNVPQFP